MTSLNLSEITDEITVCPYCMDEINPWRWNGCCGETHTAQAYVTRDGECYLESEVTVVDDTVLQPKKEV